MLGLKTACDQLCLPHPEEEAGQSRQILVKCSISASLVVPVLSLISWCHPATLMAAKRVDVFRLR